MTTSEIPNGFEILSRGSPYIDLVGPLYFKPDGDGLMVGLMAEEKHCNSAGYVHGGLLSTVADIALGYNAGDFLGAQIPMVTASITIDFAGNARAGDWVVYKVDVQKVGKRMAFANCYVHVGDTRIARASGIYSVLSRG